MGSVTGAATTTVASQSAGFALREFLRRCIHDLSPLDDDSALNDHLRKASRNSDWQRKLRVRDAIGCLNTHGHNVTYRENPALIRVPCRGVTPERLPSLTILQRSVHQSEHFHARSRILLDGPQLMFGFSPEPFDVRGVILSVGNGPGLVIRVAPRMPAHVLADIRIHALGDRG
eukprot:scaffold251214_cov36-Tisochrysis_lutea.AAC.1